jgi:hypothetical protein
VRCGRIVSVGTERFFSMRWFPLLVLKLRPSLLLFHMGAVEGTDGEIQKENRYGCVDEELVVVRAGSPVGTEAVGALNEEEAEDRKEESGDLEPEDAASVDKWAPDGFSKPFRTFLNSGDGVLGPLGVDGSVLPDGLCGLRGPITQHSGCDTNTNSQSAAYAIRLHRENFISRGDLMIAGHRHHK